MDGVSAAASILAIVELAGKTTLLCVKYSTAVKNANKDISRLQDELTGFGGVLRQAHKSCSGPNGSKLSASHDALAALKQCFSQLDELHDKLKPAKRSRLASAMKLNELKWPLESKHVDKVIEDIERYKSTLSLAFQIDQISLIQDMLTAMELEKLPAVDEAAFDSFSGQLDPRCHEQTRVELRKQIQTWADDPSSKHIFWLNGAAGSGKSTIARTIAQHYSDLGFLGASFFFKRGEGDRGNATRLFTTIAAHLVKKVPPLRPAIKKALEVEPSISAKSMREQFDKLLFEPLKDISSTHTNLILIVVDALDECENLEHIKMLIHLLSRTNKIDKIRIRCFLTSRPELPIRLGFKEIDQTSYQGIVLHEIPSSIVRSDLTIYLKHELSVIQVSDSNRLATDWPGEDKIEELVSIVDPLFISAATICRFVGDHRFDPDEQIELILRYKHGDQMDQLALTYQPVLDSLLVGLNSRQKDRLLQEFQRVVGTIIILADSLSISSLCVLLGLPISMVERRLDSLHSVLDVPADVGDPVRLFHLSFRDYLIDDSRKDQPFLVNEAEMHRQIVSACLKLLITSPALKRDICDLGIPGIQRKDIDINTITACLSPAVQYACRYWTFHLERSMHLAHDEQQIHEFLETRAVFWIEALSLMGRSYEMLEMMEILERYAKETPNSAVLELADNAREFVHPNLSLFEMYPLQIYFSGLWFVPKTNVFRRLFGHLIPESRCELPRFQDAWNGIVQHPGHLEHVRCTAISFGTQQLASGSHDSTVKLWHLPTGKLQHTLYGHTGIVIALSFTSEGSLLASGGMGGSVMIWNTDTGALITTLDASGTCINFLSFSNTDAYLLATGANLFSTRASILILMWDTSFYNTRHLSELEDVYEAVECCFSSDDSQVALLLCPRLSYSFILLFESDTGTLMTRIKLDRKPSSVRLVFGYQLLVTAYEGGPAQICDIAMRSAQQEMNITGESLALSPSGCLYSLPLHLATLVSQRSIDIWTTTNIQSKVVLKDCRLDSAIRIEEDIRCVFSQDEKHFAAFIVNVGIRMWDTVGGRLIWSFDDQTFACPKSCYICDKSGWIVAINESKVDIWHATDQSLQTAFDVQCQRNLGLMLKLSPDGSTLASWNYRNSLLKLGNATTSVDLHAAMAYPKMEPHFMAFSLDSSRLVYIAEDETYTSQWFGIWELNRSKPQQLIEFGTRRWSPSQVALAVSPDASLLASVDNSSDQAHWTMKFFDTITGEVCHTIDVPEEDLEYRKERLLFNPDVSIFATLNGNGAHLWNTRTGTLHKTLIFPHGVVEEEDFSTCAAFSPSGSYLLVGTYFGGIIVVHVGSSVCSRVDGHSTAVIQVAASPAEDIIVTVSDNGTLKIWNLYTMEPCYTDSSAAQLEKLLIIEDEGCIQTDRGKIPLQLIEVLRDIPNHIFVKNEWLSINMVNQIWLPLAYRPIAIDAVGDKIVMMFASGRILSFDSEADPAAGCSRYLN